MKKYIKHFITISKHKWYVMLFCFKCGYIKRGLLHDLSKYGLTEFRSSAKHFQGDRSPINAEKEVRGYSIAWQHHKGHNPHHWEYWIDNVGTYKNNPIEMPHEYIIEMICDWLAAGIVYGKNKVDFNEPYSEPYDYYRQHENEMILAPLVKKSIIVCLEFIKNFGINKFCKFEKNNEFYNSERIG